VVAVDVVEGQGRLTEPRIDAAALALRFFQTLGDEAPPEICRRRVRRVLDQDLVERGSCARTLSSPAPCADEMRCVETEIGHLLADHPMHAAVRCVTELTEDIADGVTFGDGETKVA